MEYISVSQYAAKYGISERTARNYCTAGKIQGAFLTGKTWNIPEEAVLLPAAIFFEGTSLPKLEKGFAPSVYVAVTLTL